MSYLRNQGICRGAPRTEEILTEGEIETVKRYVQERDMDVLDLADEEFLAILNQFRTDENKLIPTFSFPSRRSARLIEQRKRRRDAAD
jgi:hypothetical protein